MGSRFSSKILVALALCVGGLTWWGIHLDREIVRQFNGKRWGLPSKIYSNSFALVPGQSLLASHLLERLQRLGYRNVEAGPAHKGEYYRSTDYVEVFLHNFLYPSRSFSGYPLRIEFQEGVITKLIDTRNPRRRLDSAELEPELIAGLFEKIWEERKLVSLKQVPHPLIDAIIVTEDKRFYHHWGVDLIAIGRATMANLKAGRIVQGASTLTQQLVKNFFLSHRRNLWTKIQGAFMAILLERHYSKDQILEAYLNEIFFGQRGIQGIYGAGEAAVFYFGKPIEELDLEESAFLAGLIRAPSMYSPRKNPELIRTRRDRVLRSMWTQGMISEAQYKKAIALPIKVKPYQPQTNEAPYFVDYLIEELTEDFSLDFLTSEGLRIFTTLDAEMQRTARTILGDELSKLEGKYPHTIQEEERTAGPLQGCMVVLEPRTGHIKVLLGGREYQKGGLNRATESKRQPGSLFKPFVYLTALEKATPSGERFTPSSSLRDEPLTLRYDHKQWSPKNYNDQYFGNVSLRKALEMSLNCATVRLSQKVGLSHIIATAKNMGLTTPMEPLPSLALGAFEAIPFELAAAYGALANQGILTMPHSIKAVVDGNGQILENKRVEAKRVVSAEGAFLTTYLLKGVLDRGTASAARSSISFPAAGKTGTTNNYQDAWFCGYTPRIVTLVWVGFDEPESTGLSGAQAALPIWTRFMQEAAATVPADDFPVPPGIVFRKIDRANGLLATTGCPEPFLEAFQVGTEPMGYCPLHPPKRGIPEVIRGIPKGILEKFLNLFRKKGRSD